MEWSVVAPSSALALLACVCAGPLACGDSSGPSSSGETEGTSSGEGTGDSAPSTESSGAATEDPTGATSSGVTSDASASTTAGPTETTGEPDPEPDPYPEPDAFEPNSGPGGPSTPFTPEQLWEHCAYLDGGADDDIGNGETHDTFDHHNLVVMFDGYLMMPWSPEFGLNSGITFYDVSDPCSPTAVGTGTSSTMRESHTLGVVPIDGRWYAVVDSMRLDFPDLEGGVEFWDVTDVTDAHVVSKLNVPGFVYPDAYARVTLSAFWQAPYVYVGGSDNGVYVIDARDPMNPILVDQYKFDPVLRVGQVQAIGNILMASAAEGTRTALLDISVPNAPQPLPGGEFDIERESYFSNMQGGYAYYAPKEGGGGLIVWDISDPQSPQPVADYSSGGNGGYVFAKDEYAFVGESDFANVYDLSDLPEVTPIGTGLLEGDLDTITPIGNVVVLSVDDKANKDQASAIVPWQEEVDTKPPRVTYVYPPDGAEGVTLLSRVGLTMSEFVDPKSAWEGSVRLYQTGTDPAVTRVHGYISVGEVIINFAPMQPLKPATQYTLELPAGGVRDYNDNALAEPFTMTFTTAG
ncbi:MAG: Ig-like domain-containing protein [Myxococcales bacterium]|nr:Ig-like domain-containing protein [Myxococcales bacterium]